MHLFALVGSRVLIMTTTLAAMCLTVYLRGRAIEWSLDDLRPYAEQEAQRELGRPVSIGKIRGNPFTRIELLDVRIGHIPADGRSGNVVSVDRVDVRYSLWSALRKRVSYKRCVKSIDLYSPDLYLHRYENGVWQLASDLRKREKKPREKEIADRFAGVIRIHDGNAEYLDEYFEPNKAGEHIHFVGHEVNAKADFGRIGRLDLIGNMAMGDQIRRAWVEGSVLLDQSAADLMLEAQGTSLAEVLKWIVEPDDPGFRLLSGELGHARAALTWGSGRPLEYFVRGAVADAQLQIPSVGSQPFALQGDLNATGHHVGSNGLVVDYGRTHAVAAGTVFHIGHDDEPTRLELFMASDQVDYGELLQEYPVLSGLFEDVQTSGAGSAEMSLVGTPDDLIVEGSFLSPPIFARTSYGWEASCSRLELLGRAFYSGGEIGVDMDLAADPMDLVIRDALASVVQAREEGATPEESTSPPVSPDLHISASVSASIVGPVESPGITGRLEFGSMVALGAPLDRITGDFEVARVVDLDPPAWGTMVDERTTPIFVADLNAQAAYQRLVQAAAEEVVPLQRPEADGPAPIASAEGDSPWVVRAEDIVADALGGRVKLDVSGEINGPLSEWVIESELEGIDLAQAAHALALDDLEAGGLASGRATVRVSPESEYPEIIAQARARDVTAVGYELGEIRGTAELARDGWARIRQLDIFSPYGDATVWGDVGLMREARELDLAFETQPLRVDAIEGLPEGLTAQGLALATGVIGGTLESVTASGDAQVLDGRIEYARVAADGAVRLVASDFDSAQTHFDYRDGVLTLTELALRTGGARILTDVHDEGDAPPRHSYIAFSPEGTAYDLDVSITDITAKQLLEVLAYEDTGAFRGRLCADARVVGVGGEYDADATLALYEGVVSDQPIDLASASVRTEGADLLLENLQAVSGTATLRADGWVGNIAEEPELHLSWIADGIPVSRLSEDLSRVHGLRGTLRASGGLDGVLDSLYAFAAIESDRIGIRDEAFTDVRLSGIYFTDPEDGEQVVLLGYDEPLRAKFGGGIMEGEGEYLIGQRRLTANAQMRGVRTDPLADVARAYLFQAAQQGVRTETQRAVSDVFGSLGGDVSGEVEITGPTDNLAIHAKEIELANATYDGLQIPPIAGSLRYETGVLELDEVSIADATGAMSGSATIDMTDDGRVAGHLSATNIQLAPFMRFFSDHDILTEGVAEAHLVFHGRVARPSIEGVLSARDVALDIDHANRDLPLTRHRLVRFPDMDAQGLSVTDGAIRLRELTFQGATGNGERREVRVADVLLPFRWAPIGVVWEQPVKATIAVPEQDLSLLSFLPWVSPEDATGRMEAHLTIGGTLQKPMVTGRLDVRDGRYVVRTDDVYTRAVLRQYDHAVIPIENIQAGIRFERSPGDQRSVITIEAFGADAFGGHANLTGSADVPALMSGLAEGGYAFRLTANGLTHNIFTDDPADTEGVVTLSDLDVRLVDRGRKPTLVVESGSIDLGPGRIALAGSVGLGRRPGAGMDLAHLGYNEWDLTSTVARLPLDLGDIERLVRVVSALNAGRAHQVVTIADYGVARMDGTLRAVGPGDGATPTRITSTDLRLSDAKVNLASGGSSGGDPPSPGAIGRTTIALRRDFDADLRCGIAQNVRIPDYQMTLYGDASIVKEGPDLHIRGEIHGDKGEAKVSYFTFNLQALTLGFAWSTLPGGTGQMGPASAHLSADGDTSVISEGRRTKIMIHVEGPLLGETERTPQTNLAMLGGRPGGSASEIQAGQLRLTLSSDPPLPQHQILQLIGQDVGLPLSTNPQDQFDFSRVASADLVTVLAETFLGSFVERLANLAGIGGITMQYNARTGTVTMGVDRAITDKLYLEGYYIDDEFTRSRLEGRVTYDLTDRLQLRTSIDERAAGWVELRYHAPF